MLKGTGTALPLSIHSSHIRVLENFHSTTAFSWDCKKSVFWKYSRQLVPTNVNWIIRLVKNQLVVTYPSSLYAKYTANYLPLRILLVLSLFLVFFFIPSLCFSLLTRFTKYPFVLKFTIIMLKQTEQHEKTYHDSFKWVIHHSDQHV